MKDIILEEAKHTLAQYNEIIDRVEKGDESWEEISKDFAIDISYENWLIYMGQRLINHIKRILFND